MKPLIIFSIAAATLVAIAIIIALAVTLTPSDVEKKPNFIIFLADDTGYADFRWFGHPVQEGGTIERMAEEGIVFNQWYSAAPCCSPSRAAMLTGRYPVRSGAYGHNNTAFVSGTSGGLPSSETTLAEALSGLGYTNGFLGKWHLGNNHINQSDGTYLPIHQGFDYVGTVIPFSGNAFCDPSVFTVDQMALACYLYNNTNVVQQPIDFTIITEKLLYDAKNFVRNNKQNPFYLQFSFPHTHTALFCNDNFCGKSERGIYGDNVNEMAWAIGEMLDLLKELEIDENTLSLFLSDNGPDKTGCPWGGSPGLFRGGKGTTWEGGVRVPAIARWPGTLPKGVVSEAVVNSVDIFPTFLTIAGESNYAKDNNIVIDGVLIKDLLNENPNGEVDREIMFYYCSDRIFAVRYKQYKIHYFTMTDGDFSYRRAYENPGCTKFSPTIIADYGCYGTNVEEQIPPLVFDLGSDPAEDFVLNSTEKDIQDMLDTVNELVAEHQSTVVKVPAQFDAPSGPEYIPCCNPPSCVCNYE